MDPAQTMQSHKGGPLDETGLCLLSLDGGGVRGLSTLLILKALMAKVNAERIKHSKETVKPCELFDLVGGTSTGGIIAIMLGRLEMDVDECIDVYTNLSKRIFSSKGLPVNLFGKVKGRFDSIVLEECIADILKKRGLGSDEAFQNSRSDACKVVVCVKTAETSNTTLIRSYTSSDVLNNIAATISEAARATSAASSFFEPVEIGPRRRKFVDGGLGANNPVEQIWNEAQNEWCSSTQQLGDIVKCFISIGTGNPGVQPIADGALKFFKDTLVKLATQTEATAKLFVSRHRLLYDSKRYFRFNVDQGLQGVGLEEFRKEAAIDTATCDYMDRQEIKSALQHCAVNLGQKQCLLQVCPEDIIERNRLEISKAHHSQNSITLMPFARNVNFIDRSDTFKQLMKLLSFNTSGNAAIYGLGGCGKTQIALEYAYRRQEFNSCSIFWVHGENQARFTQSYEEVAKKLNLSSELKGVDLLKAVKERLEEQDRWLLIIDNVDHLTIYKNNTPVISSGPVNSPSAELGQFVPQTHNDSQTAILWTSRDGAILDQLIGIGQGVAVGTMTDHESQELFHRLCGTTKDQASEETVQALVELLESIPLAIAQAAAYIRKTGITLQRYVTLFNESEERRANILRTEFNDIHRPSVPNSVMRTWTITIEQLASETPLTKEILNTIAFFDNQGLPFQLLREAAGADFTEDEVLLAAGRLAEFSILQIQQAADDGLPTYQQHRLVQLATRESLDDSHTSSFVEKALNIMTELFPKGGYENWETCRLYLPHSLSVASYCNRERSTEELSHLLARVGYYYREQGRLNEEEKLEVEVLTLRKSVLGEQHPDTIRAMANLATTTWWQQGRSDEAEKLGIEVLTLCKSVLGEQHPDTIQAMANLAMANLASTWWQQGRLDEAEKLGIEVLTLCKSVLGEQHPDTIRAMANLATTWWQQGRSDEAEKLGIEVLTLRKSVLGEQHPDTIRAMANLASTWWQQGRLGEAEKLEVEVLTLRKSVLGEHHPDTIRAMANLASTWWQQGRSDEAEKLGIEVLTLCKSVLGEQHLDTIRAMANLATTWWQQGRSDEAEKLEVEVLTLRKSVLGEQHLDTIQAMANLATTWWQQGRSDEAEKLEVEVLTLRKSVLGEQHLDTIRAMANLASTWWQQGRLGEAEKLEVEVLTLRKSVLGEHHPDTVSAVEALDWMQQEHSDEDSANNSTTGSVRAYSPRFGPNQSASNTTHSGRFCRGYQKWKQNIKVTLNK